MKAITYSITGFLLCLAIFVSCKKEAPITTENNRSQTPLLQETVYDYPNSENDALASLGRVLFYDRNLSLNNSVACGSCHQQLRAFCDNMKFGTGLEDQNTARNT